MSMYMVSDKSPFLLSAQSCGCGLCYPLKWKFLCVQADIPGDVCQSLMSVYYHATTVPSEITR